MAEISVIIPFYNVEKYIEKCINSVKNQTFTDFECLLIDDESPDNSLKIAQKNIENDSRFRIIRQKNKGLGGARNTGIENAKGNWLIFLDSDDFWQPNMLEKMLKTAKEQQADIVGCQFQMVYENSKVEPSGWKSPIGIFTKENEIFNTLLYHHAAWDKLYKKQIFNDVRFPEKFLHEDFATLYKTAEFCKKLVIIPDVLYNYLQREQSIMSTYSIKNIEDILTTIKALQNEKYKKHNTITYCLSMIYDLIGRTMKFSISEEEKINWISIIQQRTKNINFGNNWKIFNKTKFKHFLLLQLLTKLKAQKIYNIFKLKQKK